MSSMSSLEVYRSVILPPSSAFAEEVVSIGREIFDSDGMSAVALPTDDVIRTTKVGARYIDENSLRWYHLSVAGPNVKHFGNKIIRARDKLENGTGVVLQEEESLDHRAGREPLKATYDFMMRHSYDKDPDDFFELKLNEVDEVEYPMLYTGKKVFVLRATETAKGSSAEMLHRMTSLARIALKNSGSPIAEIANGAIINSIPFADTRSGSEATRRQFIEHVRELLPVTVYVSQIDFNTRY